MNSITLQFDEDGSALGVYSDELLGLFGDLGAIRIARASHVEPSQGPLGGWEADMAPVGGPVLGSFVTRSEALDAEQEWLRQHMHVMLLPEGIGG